MKHLYIALFTALMVSCSNAQITPFETPKTISLKLLPQNKDSIEFRVITPGKEGNSWQKLVDMFQTITASGDAKCQIQVRNAGASRAITFDIVNGIFILSSKDILYLKESMDLFSFSLYASVPKSKFISSWQSCGIEYYTNPLFVQNCNGHLYFGGEPAVGKPQLLRPLIHSKDSPLIFVPIVKENELNIAINIINSSNKNIEFQHISNEGKESQWTKLGYSIKDDLDLKKAFKIRVRLQNESNFAEFCFDRPGEISFTRSSAKIWSEKLTDLMVAIKSDGIISGKDVEIVKWMVNNNIVEVRGPVWIGSKQGNLSFKADKEISVPLPNTDIISLKSIVGEKLPNKPDIPSLTPDIPKNRKPNPPVSKQGPTYTTCEVVTPQVFLFQN